MNTPKAFEIRPSDELEKNCRNIFTYNVSILEIGYNMRSSIEDLLSVTEN